MNTEAIGKEIIKAIKKAKKEFEKNGISASGIYFPIDLAEDLIKIIYVSKTLEKIGYTNEMDERGFVCWRRHYRNSLKHDKIINMYEDGHITFNTFMELTKEDYEAIGYEMRKRGWWK